MQRKNICPFINTAVISPEDLDACLEQVRDIQRQQADFDKLGEYQFSKEQTEDLSEYSATYEPKILFEVINSKFLVSLLIRGKKFLDSIESDDAYLVQARLDLHRSLMRRSKNQQNHCGQWATINKLFSLTFLSELEHFHFETITQIKEVTGACIFWANGLEEKNFLQLIKRVSQALIEHINQLSTDLEHDGDERETRMIIRNDSIRYLAKILTNLMSFAVDGLDENRSKTEYLLVKGCTEHVHKISFEIKDEFKRLIQKINESTIKDRLINLNNLDEWPFRLLNEIIPFAPEDDIYQLWDLASFALGCMPIISYCSPMLLVAKWLSSFKQNWLKSEQAELITKFCLIYLDNSHILDPFYAIQVLQILILRQSGRITESLGYSIVVSTILAKERQIIAKCPDYRHQFIRHDLTYIFISFYAIDKFKQLHRFIDKARQELTLESHIQEWFHQLKENTIGYLDEATICKVSRPKLEPWHNYYIGLLALPKLTQQERFEYNLNGVLSHLMSHPSTFLISYYQQVMGVSLSFEHRDFYQMRVFQSLFREAFKEENIREFESIHYYRDANSIEFLDKPFLEIDQFEEKLKIDDKELWEWWEESKVEIGLRMDMIHK